MLISGSKANLLGVIFTERMQITKHVSMVVNCCNQRLYLLVQLMNQGLCVTSRERIFEAIIINKLMYATSVLYSYLTDKDKQQINSMFRKAECWQLVLKHYDFDLLAKTAESQLFKKSMNSTHCLNHLYTQKETAPNAMILRKRGHNFVLPSTQYAFNNQQR